jgi:hypothetical protein
VTEICRPDGLGDIANLDLTLADTQAQAGLFDDLIELSA